MGLSQKIIEPDIAKKVFKAGGARVTVKDSVLFNFSFRESAFFKGDYVEPDFIGYVTYYIKNTSPKNGIIKWYEDTRKVYADKSMQGYLFYLNCIIPLSSVLIGNRFEDATQRIEGAIQRKLIRARAERILNSFQEKKLTKAQKELLLQVKDAFVLKF